jgi:hypothetical protein
VDKLNEEAIANLLTDVEFIEQSLREAGKSHLTMVFDGLTLVSTIQRHRSSVTQIRSAGFDTSQQHSPRLPQSISSSSVLLIGEAEAAGRLIREVGQIWV